MRFGNGGFLSAVYTYFAALPQVRCEPKPEVVQRQRSQMQQRNCPNPSAALQQEKRTLVQAAAKSAGAMTELRTMQPLALVRPTGAFGPKRSLVMFAAND